MEIAACLRFLILEGYPSDRRHSSVGASRNPNPNRSPPLGASEVTPSGTEVPSPLLLLSSFRPPPCVVFFVGGKLGSSALRVERRKETVFGSRLLLDLGKIST
ncbi:hypothetical protein C4D60_Mb03t18010 [Musa balbisiana]|uniref:Uncharacterized protein n=1 Tax=Musa balbisiana TaxID=52838 RepID=A0A4S8JAP6_MUSBA|nr:hypothetical protein C4D60_Mb03t18010 [Musa balbisiana]